MRVTIGHREEATGFSGKGRNYFVDCRVEFSEEEKAIIQARALHNHIIMDAHLQPPPPPVHRSGPFWMRLSAPWLVLAGLVIGFLSLFTHAGGNLGPMILFVGLAFWLLGPILFGKQQAAWDSVPVTVHRLMGSNGVSLYAVDPAAAKGLDEEFRDGLAGLKKLIVASAELRSKETFDL
jgi:hypothetical protein